MAPELVDGARDARPAADLYALGVLASELLTGALPFEEPPYVARLRGRPAPAPARVFGSVDPELGALLERCLAVDPAARPAAAELARALSAPPARAATSA